MATMGTTYRIVAKIAPTVLHSLWVRLRRKVRYGGSWVSAAGSNSIVGIGGSLTLTVRFIDVLCLVDLEVTFRSHSEKPFLR